MGNMMKAIRLTGKCETKDMIPVEVEIPKLEPGRVIVEVKAFGVNESEVTSRRGESSSDFSFPRILGIEGVGIVSEINEGSSFKVGQKVATMMGGMGREFDGSYAEYMSIKEENLIPIDTDLSWDIVGALTEMLQTAYGSLTRGLRIKKGDIVLIHGATSTVGIMGVEVAKMLGAEVIATTRKKEKLEILREYGADYALIDDDTLYDKIREIAPDGIDKVFELVGLSKLFSDMALLKDGGLACYTGDLAGNWTIDNFSPFMIPKGRYLTSYDGASQDLPADVFNNVLNKVKEGTFKVPIAKVYRGLEEVGQAQDNLESSKFVGKHVVVL